MHYTLQNKYFTDIISSNSLNQKVKNNDTEYPIPPLQVILPGSKYLTSKKKYTPNQTIITEEAPLTINPHGISQINHQTVPFPRVTSDTKTKEDTCIEMKGVQISSSPKDSLDSPLSNRSESLNLL